jgi:hypothetical protein
MMPSPEPCRSPQTSQSLRGALFLAWLLTFPVAAGAAELTLTYFRVTNADTADTIEQINQRFDKLERLLKERRRAAAFGSAEHDSASAELDRLRVQRDREFLRTLARTTPVFEYTADLKSRERNRDSRNIDGKPLRTDFLLREADNATLSLDLEIHFDGNQIYRGGDVNLRPDEPHLLAKGFVRTGEGPQGSMLFILLTR